MATLQIISGAAGGAEVTELSPLPYSISGTVTLDGSGVSRKILFLTDCGVLVGTTQSATDGTYSFSVGIDFPLIVLVLGASGERPLAHVVTPG